MPDDKILSLSKKKGEGKLIQIDGSPPIGYNTLHKNLSVIYDVPTNPSERLKAVINDLSNWNNRLENKIKNTTRYFNDITKEFDSVRDEEKITDLKEKLSNQKKEISNHSLPNQIIVRTCCVAYEKLFILECIPNATIGLRIEKHM